MADGADPDSMPEQWNEIVARMNERMVEGMEAGTEAQAGFVESWIDAFESTDEEQFTQEFEGNRRAHAAWMEAAEETAEKMSAAARGEEFDPEEVRDLWLDSANEAFKEVVSTEAFASMTGQTVEEALDVRGAVDETAQSTLREFGLATERDVREVGERLVELERRQKKVERKLERLEEIETKLDRALETLGESA